MSSYPGVEFDFCFPFAGCRAEIAVKTEETRIANDLYICPVIRIRQSTHPGQALFR